MLNTRSIFTAITLGLLLAGTQCKTQPLPPIYGKIVLNSSWKPMVYLVQPGSFNEIASNYSGVVLDSANVHPDGSFTFSALPQIVRPALLQVCVQKTGARFNNQLVDDNPKQANYMPIVLQNGECLEIKANTANFQASFAIKNPGADNLALLLLRDLRHEAFFQLSTAGAPENTTDDAAQLLAEAEALLRFQAPLMAFADSCAHFLPSLVAARWVSPSGDYERVPEFLVKLCTKWRTLPSESPLVQQLCASGDRGRLPVLLHDKMPNEALPLSTGDTVMLHNLLGKRLTIVDIWASWCMPCRRENREFLLPLWKTYRAAGLQILGYSIDSSPNAWKAAIDKDGAVWPHASHLTGDATPFLEALRISTIPANFLLDADGKVVAKNLHGEALRDFVVDYLK